MEYIEDLGDRERSLLLMRERMFSDYNFTAAVFIGGMKGIIDEFELLEKMQPTAIKIPVMSAGGATLDLAQRIGTVSTDLATNMDYIALFHRHLGISVKENRYQTPEAQPASIVDRLWRQ
ncbi:hypothetical protein D3C80_1450010 [compost metagenome]